jgi:hypothetical protein
MTGRSALSPYRSRGQIWMQPIGVLCGHAWNLVKSVTKSVMAAELHLSTTQVHILYLVSEASILQSIQVIRTACNAPCLDDDLESNARKAGMQHLTRIPSTKRAIRGQVYAQPMSALGNMRLNTLYSAGADEALSFCCGKRGLNSPSQHHSLELWLQTIVGRRSSG